MKRLLPAVRRGRTFWRASGSRTEPGQFGLHGLHAARDWDGIASSCVERCEKLADAIRATAAKPTVHVLDLFDTLSNDICTVLDTYVVVSHQLLTTRKETSLIFVSFFRRGLLSIV